RIGRTARAGRSGKAFTIATKADTRNVDAIEKLIGQKIEWHDGDLSTVIPSAGDDERQSRHSRGKERGVKRERGGKREKGRQVQTAEAGAEEAAEQPSLVPAEVIEARRQRKQAIRSDNAERGSKTEEPRRDERKPRGERPQRHREDDEANTVVGF